MVGALLPFNTTKVRNLFDSCKFSDDYFSEIFVFHSALCVSRKASRNPAFRETTAHYPRD